MIPEKVNVKKNVKELKLNPNYSLIHSKSTNFTISNTARNMEDWQRADGGFEMGPGK